MAGVLELNVKIQIQRDAFEKYEDVEGPGEEEDTSTSLVCHLVSIL